MPTIFNCERIFRGYAPCKIQGLKGKGKSFGGLIFFAPDADNRLYGIFKHHLASEPIVNESVFIDGSVEQAEVSLSSNLFQRTSRFSPEQIEDFFTTT